jgi:plastocyanin
MTKRLFILVFLLFIAIGTSLFIAYLHPDTINKKVSVLQNTTREQEEDEHDEGAPPSKEAIQYGEEYVGDTVITILNSTFSPDTVTVKKNTKVLWRNSDTKAYTILFSSGSEREIIVPTKKDAYVIFPNEGIVTYYIKDYPANKATIKVISL